MMVTANPEIRPHMNLIFFEVLVLKVRESSRATVKGPEDAKHGFWNAFRWETAMNRLCFILSLLLLGQSLPAAPAMPLVEERPLEKSSYFAFADRDYIFTIEIVKPGVPLLNFVSMTDQDIRLLAKNIRLTLENRKVSARMFAIETGDFQRPMIVAALTMHPRSSFGVRLEGDFNSAKEVLGATIRLGDEDLKLAPLSNTDFEILVMKVNRINLGSPDFGDDWKVLRLHLLGSRSRAGR
jgi:hypothetical protein